ncbi:unnamed protein product [Closterium sp. NIES-53]
MTEFFRAHHRAAPLAAPAARAPPTCSPPAAPRPARRLCGSLAPLCSPRAALCSPLAAPFAASVPSLLLAPPGSCPSCLYSLSIQFDTWLDDLQLYLLSDSRDNVSLFDHTSGASLAPPATADSATCSQWLTRDAATRLAIRNHRLLAERAHFGQHKTAKALYDAVVARYSSPATAALGHLLLPYLFPELSAFATVEDLVAHLRTSVARYRGALPAEFLDRNPPPMGVPLAPSYASAAAVDILGAADVGAASALSGKRRSSKGKGGRSGGGGSRAGGGGRTGGGGGSGGGGSGGSGGESGGFGGSGGGSGGGGGSGSSGSGGSRGGAAELLRSGVDIFALDYDAILAAMYVPVCTARPSTTLTPLPAPVPVRIADPSGGPVLAYSSTVLPCPAVPSSSLSGLHLPYELGEYHCPTPGGQRVSIYTCTRTGRHLGTFTRRPRSSLYTLATRPLQVAALAQLSAPGPIALPCSCRLLSHRTLSWHHRLGHPSLPRLHGMHSRLLVSGLPRSLPPLPPSPAPPCLPCVEGRLSLGSAQSVSRSASGSARTFLSCIGTLTEVVSSPPTSCGLCRGEGILQSFTLLASPQQNGIAERRIGLVMEVARTSMIHAATPHFLWPFAVQYAAHQLNLWPRVSLSETSPTLRWTGKVGNASAFRTPSPLRVLLPQVDPLPGTVPVEVAVDSGAGRGAASAGAEPKGAGAEGTRAGGTGARGTGAGRAGAGGVGTGDPGAGVAGAVDPGAGGVGAWGAASGGTDSFKERRELECRPPSPVRAVCIGRRVPRPRPPPVPDTHVMALRPSSVLLQVPLPPPPASSLPAIPDPESDLARGASPTVTRLLAVVVTDPSFESTAASALVAEHVDFAAACRLDYATSLVAESESDCPLSVEGECALGTDVLEDKQENFECLAAAIPHLVAMVLAPKGDPDAPDIPTPRSYAQVITGPYSSQWQTAMDAEMASWKSTGTYLDEVPPSGANIVDGMWIFRVNRSPGSLPVFKARYIARGFSQRQGVDFFQTFSPTPKMTTLRVLLHVAAQRDYKLHSLDFSTSFLQGNLHEEIWLHHPPGFTGMTIAALGFAPSTADVSLFLRTDTSLPPFYVLVYDDDLVFATGDTEALALVKSELQKRHTCTDLGELRSYLGLQITRDRARRTITLT